MGDFGLECTAVEGYCLGEYRKEDPYSWESAVRVTVGREEELGMYLEEREGRKRKWQEGGKMLRKDDDEREQRRVPPKKILAAVTDMGGSGTSSSSSHMSPPGWQVNDLDLDLPGELSMNEALLSLAVFKQEAPSPTGQSVLPPRRAWTRPHERQQITSMVVDTPREQMSSGCQQSPGHNGVLMQHNAGNGDNLQCPPMAAGAMMQSNGYHSPTSSNENKNAGLLMCSPVTSLDGFLNSPVQQRQDASFKDDTRFQYVLAAATSIATKTSEETLTYLNQGQPYEIKLKKLGDLSHYKGKILKSIIKICFHERRLQYMEREQIAQWHAERPGERIVEVDVPLSYGVIKVQHPTNLNALHVFWDPTKDVGVYIKVNCISTEFTAKKHGGEKGVPFRIQVETYLGSDDNTRLHAAACQIKVFKLKGADRKHKQDREKVMRRPRSDLEKYQPGCEATVLTTLSNDAMMPPPSLVAASPPYSPEICESTKSSNSVQMVNKQIQQQPALLAPVTQMKQLYCQESIDIKASSPPCHSPGTILPDLPQTAASDEADKNVGLSSNATSQETHNWLVAHRFQCHTETFNNFSGADLLRLSRDDIIQICGLADGIRLYNALHPKRIEPRLTIYVCPVGSSMYSALYLHACGATELLSKLFALMQSTGEETVIVSGPNGARVRLTDELVRHLPDNSTWRMERTEDNALLMCSNNQ